VGADLAYVLVDRHALHECRRRAHFSEGLTCARAS
jgi:hypothetical protein